MIDAYYNWNSKFNNIQIKDINKYIENNYDELESKEMSAHSNGKSLKNVDSTKLIRWKKVKHLFNEVYGFADYVLTHQYGFLTYPYPDDKFVNLNTYTSNNKNNYSWHVDQSKAIDNFDIKGTLLINLSESKYEGGNLKLFHQGELIVDGFSEPGSMVLIHGFMNHEVTPVIKGVRKTFSMFIGGPRWR
tara:strand:- start:963 stop:1529 length:567 start_codon:yes stop_codon:yes gene_type:complete